MEDSITLDALGDDFFLITGCVIFYSGGGWGICGGSGS